VRVAVVGAGGLGGYFGGRWAAAGLDVVFLARGAQLAALRARELRIASPLGDVALRVRAEDRAAAIGEVDLVLVATKTWQLAEAAAGLAPLLGGGTAVVGVQNGVEASAVLSAAVGAERVLAGTCRIISYLAAPGEIRHVGVQPTLTFGELSGGASERCERIRDALARGGGMTVRLADDIEAEIWRKFLFFAPVSGIGAVTQAPVGVWRRIDEVRERLVAAMEEVRAVAAARGVTLPEDLVSESLDFLDRLPPEGTSSLQRDVRDGRRTELEALCGAMVRLGREHGVATPVHAAVYAFLLPRELHAQGVVDWPVG